jgi:hypothetical protein
VSSNGKLLRSASFLVLLLLAAGCGGINMSKSVSPLDFLLPGAGSFLKADPSPTHPDQPTPAQQPVTETAKI